MDNKEESCKDTVVNEKNPELEISINEEEKKEREQEEKENNSLTEYEKFLNNELDNNPFFLSF